MGQQESTTPWFAVQVWAGRELFCQAQLVARGYEVFVPCYRDRRRWSDRIRTVDRALFTGYVFCRSSTDVVGKVVTTPGVIRVVGNGSCPLPVASHEIVALERITHTGLPLEPWQFLQVGQVVSVIAGPLRGIEGIILKSKDQQRLVVSVSLLQRSVAVEIHPTWVRVSPKVWLENADHSKLTSPVSS